MPTLHTIGAIKILMYFEDHTPPHFHAAYHEHEALFDIYTLEMIHGHLPTRPRKTVLTWAKAHQAFLMEKWEVFNPHS